MQGAVFVHEFLHLGGLTDDNRKRDGTYFWQTGVDIEITVGMRFSRIASTYDTWILSGFCIPYLNCPVVFPTQKERTKPECAKCLGK